jgi:hypothetical protein
MNRTVPELHTTIMKKVGLQVLKGVVMKTPVDTGRARGGWHLDLNVYEGAPEGRTAVFGIDVLAAANVTLTGLKFGDSIIISNNVNYIIYLEAGWSGQAPNGMLALTLEEVGAQFA